jgi:hypothetical protein
MLLKYAQTSKRGQTNPRSFFCMEESDIIDRFNNINRMNSIDPSRESYLNYSIPCNFTFV